MLEQKDMLEQMLKELDCLRKRVERLIAEGKEDRPLTEHKNVAGVELAINTSDALKMIMEYRGVGLSELADRLGKNANVICQRIRQDNISITKLNEMLDVLDYKIVLMPKIVTTQEGWMTVE